MYGHHLKSLNNEVAQQQKGDPCQLDEDWDSEEETKNNGIDALDSICDDHGVHEKSSGFLRKPVVRSPKKQNRSAPKFSSPKRISNKWSELEAEIETIETKEVDEMEASLNEKLARFSKMKQEEKEQEEEKAEDSGDDASIIEEVVEEKTEAPISSPLKRPPPPTAAPRPGVSRTASDKVRAQLYHLRKLKQDSEAIDGTLSKLRSQLNCDERPSSASPRAPHITESASIKSIKSKTDEFDLDRLQKPASSPTPAETNKNVVKLRLDKISSTKELIQQLSVRSSARSSSRAKNNYNIDDGGHGVDKIETAAEATDKAEEKLEEFEEKVEESKEQVEVDEETAATPWVTEEKATDIDVQLPVDNTTIVVSSFEEEQEEKGEERVEQPKKDDNKKLLDSSTAAKVLEHPENEGDLEIKELMVDEPLGAIVVKPTQVEKQPLAKEEAELKNEGDLYVRDVAGDEPLGEIILKPASPTTEQSTVDPEEKLEDEGDLSGEVADDKKPPSARGEQEMSQQQPLPSTRSTADTACHQLEDEDPKGLFERSVETNASSILSTLSIPFLEAKHVSDIEVEEETSWDKIELLQDSVEEPDKAAEPFKAVKATPARREESSCYQEQTNNTAQSEFNDWTILYDEHGNQYFYCETTGMSQWEDPRGEAAELAKLQEGEKWIDQWYRRSAEANPSQQQQDAGVVYEKHIEATPSYRSYEEHDERKVESYEIPPLTLKEEKMMMSSSARSPRWKESDLARFESQGYLSTCRSSVYSSYLSPRTSAVAPSNVPPLNFQQFDNTNQQQYQYPETHYLTPSSAASSHNYPFQPVTTKQYNEQMKTSREIELEEQLRLASARADWLEHEAFYSREAEKAAAARAHYTAKTQAVIANRVREEERRKSMMMSHAWAPIEDGSFYNGNNNNNAHHLV